MHSKRFKEGDERAPLPALSPKKTRNAPCALPCGANLTLLLPDDVMLLVTTAAAVPPAATVSHAPQVLRGAAYDPKLAATVALVCRRWHELCSSDDFYRRVELLALAGSAVRPSHAPMIEMLEQRLARPRYRSVCEVSLRAVALSQPLFHAISRALPGLSCISFSGCSALTAQPLIDVLPSLPSLRSLDFSSCSCTSRDASPVAPKWIALVMRAAPALTSLDVQSCLEFTTESLKNLATTTRSSLTLLNISYTSAKIHSPSLFRLLVCCTPELREFYCCGLSLPYLAHARARDGAERWSQLRTLSAGCQRNSHSFSDQLVSDCLLHQLLGFSQLLLHLDLGCASKISCASLRPLAVCRLKSFHVAHTHAVQEQELELSPLICQWGSSLESLDLSGCHFVGSTLIERARCMVALKRLFLRHAKGGSVLVAVVRSLVLGCLSLGNVDLVGVRGLPRGAQAAESVQTLRELLR